MAKADVYNLQKKKVGELDLSDEVFAAGLLSPLDGFLALSPLPDDSPLPLLELPPSPLLLPLSDFEGSPLGPRLPRP